MYELINPINPFGIGCEPITKCDEATKEWLIETGKSTKENFQAIEEIKKTKK
jgi:hypothetical protein